MDPNPFTFLGQAISQLLATNSPAIQTMGLDMFRGLAVIMIAWFGIQNALSTAQGFYGSFHFGQFANLLLVISFGLGMLTYYSSPIPGMGYSFCELITQEALQLSAQIESKQTQVIADAVTHAEEQLGQPPGEFDFLFWGWFKAFLGFSFYQVIASAFIFIFAKVLLALLGVIGPISISNAFTVLPALIVSLFVCIFGLFKIPELTGAILSGRTGTWVNPMG